MSASCCCFSRRWGIASSPSGSRYQRYPTSTFTLLICRRAAIHACMFFASTPSTVLVPISFGGIVKSIYQGVTRTKTPFGRTPKIGTRTAMPAFYVFWEVVIFLLLTVAGIFDPVAGRLLHFGFSLVNVCFLAYGFVVFLGVRDSLADMTAPIRGLGRTSEQASRLEAFSASDNHRRVSEFRLARKSPTRSHDSVVEVESVTRSD